MSKVKLTLEQSVAVDHLLTVCDNDKNLAMVSHGRIYYDDKKKFVESLEPLEEIEPLKLAQSLINGIEIVLDAKPTHETKEESPKVGEWKWYCYRRPYGYGSDDVVQKVGRVTEVNALDKWARFDNCAEKVPFENTYPANPEEIKKENETRAFRSIGRSFGEFVDGDVGYTFLGSVYTGAHNLRRLYKESRLKGFFPNESYVKLDDEHDV